MLHSLLRLGSHYRDLSHTAFRKTATRLTAAAMMLGGLAVSAKADDAASNFAAACASIKNGADRAGCMISAIEKNTAATKANTARLKAEGDAAVATSECVQFLTSGVKTGAFAKAEILEKAGGKLSDQNACPVAKQYGFGRKAEAAPAPRFN